MLDGEHETTSGEEDSGPDDENHNLRDDSDARKACLAQEVWLINHVDRYSGVV